MQRSQLKLAAMAAAALILGMVGASTAQEAEDVPEGAESILFVGNSFTFFNDGVENHVQALAASADPPRVIEVTPAVLGGATLATHHQMASLASGAPSRSLWRVRHGTPGDIPSPERDIGVSSNTRGSSTRKSLTLGLAPCSS